jgi:hypothetical protein
MVKLTRVGGAKINLPTGNMGKETKRFVTQGNPQAQGQSKTRGQKSSTKRM